MVTCSISGRIYFIPGNKNPKLVLYGHDFIINRRKMDRTLWICSAYAKTSCKSRISTSERSVVISRHNHNHPPRFQDADLVTAKSQIVKLIQK